MSNVSAGPMLDAEIARRYGLEPAAYSTDSGAAIRLIEYLYARHAYIAIESVYRDENGENGDPVWRVEIDYENSVPPVPHACAVTMPEAICRAALLAKPEGVPA